jgi:hypothetical protein
MASNPTPVIPGFKVANGLPKPRLIISVEGLDKSGKNHFAFSAPGPLAYLDFDIGDEGVIEKFQGQKTIIRPNTSYSTRFDDGKQKVEAVKEWTRFHGDYTTALKKLRSVVVDTASETWELLRLARLGKLTQVMPHHYVEVNQEYRDLVREAFEHDANLILLHKLKAEWVNGKDGKGNKTGKFERAGFSETGFLVQINLRATRVDIGERTDESDLGFRMEVLNCRQNPAIQGMVLENDMINFQFLASLVYPEIDPAVWE